jgi:hypothetical protein
MRNNLFFLGILLAGVLASSACSFKLNVPPGQVICKEAADCPTGCVCERIDRAPVEVSVCCLKPGCTKDLSDETVLTAAVAAGYSPTDASPETDGSP